MKYCVSWRNKHRWDADEVVYPINLANTIIIDAVEHPDITFIAKVDSLKNEKNPSAEQMLKIQKDYPNILFSFADIEDLKTYAEMPESGRKMYNLPVSSWNMVNLLQSFNVEYITLGEPFCFQKKNMIEYIQNERGIKLRINPTFVRPAIMTDNKNDEAICHSWILPQHTDLYEDFIDVFDLSDTGGEMRETTLFEVYAQYKEYNQQMKHLFFNYQDNLSAAFVNPEWVIKRLDCGQVCQMGKNRCHYCLAERDSFLALKNIKK